jgi:hypothetical protein
MIIVPQQTTFSANLPNIQIQVSQKAYKWAGPLNLKSTMLQTMPIGLS